LIERTATREPIRCAWCHGDLDGAFSQCDGCKTVFHEDCGCDGCPTMGCSVRALPLAVVAPTRPSLSDFFFAIMGVIIIVDGFRCFVLKGLPVPDILLKGPGPLYVLMVALHVAAAFGRVGTWAKARWRIRKARRSSFTPRRGPAKI